MYNIGSVLAFGFECHGIGKHVDIANVGEVGGVAGSVEDAYSSYFYIVRL